MAREGRIFRGTSRVLLLIALCTSLAAVPPVLRGAESIAATPQLADGVWTVQGRDRCGGWRVRLTNTQGRLSGVLTLARSSAPFRNLALEPNGSFTGTTRARLARSRRDRTYQLRGSFSGDMVSLTLEDNFCPPRHGTAVRQAGGG
jgi:hypothetical protein